VRKRTPRAPFTKPTLDDIRAYCQQRGNRVDAEAWLAHYEANGWRVGRNPMKDWRAAVRTWEHNNVGNKPKANQAGAHVEDPAWMFDTYRRTDYDQYRDHEAWGTYAEWATDEPPRSAAGFAEWLKGTT
jgi:hypothetical protein